MTVISQPKVLIVDAMRDKELKELLIARYDHFHNDTYLEFSSEFYPINTLTKSAMEEQYQEILQTDGLNQENYPFEEFIVEQGYQIEDWFLRNNVDLSKIDLVLFKIYW